MGPTLFGAPEWGTSLFAATPVPQTFNLSLAEVVALGDIPPAARALTDFLILKEWISPRLVKAVAWSVNSAPVGATSVPWGRYMFGTSLFAGAKGPAVWTPGSRGQSPWTNQNGHKN